MVISITLFPKFRFIAHIFKLRHATLCSCLVNFYTKEDT